MMANVIVAGDVTDGIPSEIIEIINSLSMHDVKAACIDKVVNGKTYTINYERITPIKEETK